MNVFFSVMNWVGIIIQALMFLFVVRASNNGSHFNPLTYILFMGLSTVTLVVTFLEKGNWILVVAWIVCDAIISIHLVRKGATLEFGKFEKTVMGLTICTAVVYAVSKYFGHGVVAVYACTFALSFACWPAMVDYKKDPLSADPVIWMLYTVSNSFCFFGLQPMSVENSLIPGVIGVLCLVILYWSLKARTFYFLLR